MKLRMLSSFAGADFALAPGDVTDRFSKGEAGRMIAAGFAVPATAVPVERAVKARPAEKRNGKKA